MVILIIFEMKVLMFSELHGLLILQDIFTRQLTLKTFFCVWVVIFA